MIAGVCGGLADYFDLDPIIVRLGFIILLLPGGLLGGLPYVMIWLLVPEDPGPDFL
jgi:phage shock protein C